MSDTTLQFASPEWAWPVAAMILVTFIFLLYGYRFSQMPMWLRAVCGICKFVAMVALALCLLQPVRTGERPRPQANLMPILVDESASMQVGFDSSKAALQTLGKPFRPEAGWKRRLEQDFDVRTYAYSDRLRQADDLAQLQYDGSASELATSLNTLSVRFQNRPLAGILLFTDGNSTQPLNTETLKQLGFPVYPVLRKRKTIHDLQIVSATVRQSDFEAAPVTIDVQVKATGLAGEPATIQLTDQKGKVVDKQQTFLAPEDNDGKEMRFQFRPEKSGIHFYTVSTFLDSDSETFAEGRSKQEATLANNRRMLMVDRPQGPFRILYVAGRPNWEFKFLRRSLAADEEIQLTGLIRIAKRQPKFNFRDSTVQSTNPLFAGLGANEEEAAESIDEPVILTLGEPGDEDLPKAFPREIEELFAYDAIILDDIEAAFFTTDQQLMLRRFVAERGGGLMALGGQESFEKGDYFQTPIGELLPVYLPGKRFADQDLTSTDTGSEGLPDGWRFALTREGLLHPWLRVETTESRERDRLRQMTPLLVRNQILDAKPGAEILANLQSMQDPNRTFPALVTQRFGKGRTSAVLAGDFWRWFMHVPAAPAPGTTNSQNQLSDDNDPGRRWRQWVRWLVSDLPRPIQISIEEPTEKGSPHRIQVDVRDEAFRPLDNAQVHFVVVDPNETAVELTAVADETIAGRYFTTYWSPLPGHFLTEVTVQRPDGSILGLTESGWTSDQLAEEYEQLQVGTEAMEQLALSTEGEVLDISDLDRFVRSLESREMPVMETWTYPIWHRPWMMLIALGCLCTEWGLRRWKGWP